MTDPEVTQRPSTGIVAELEAEGYENAEPVGRGGFGVVYRCRQAALDRDVAIKVLNSESDDLDVTNFDREQRAMGRVSGHPNIVPVLHSGLTFAGRPYIVLPYHGRDTLGSWLKAHGPLGLEEALTIGVRLAGALETAHRAGVLHRDVKPPNVLLTDYGEPQLSDFGIARIAGSREAPSGVVVGSPSYTAPELYKGGVPSIAADVYGLAATIFALLNGRPPFVFNAGENVVAFVARVLRGPIPDLRPLGVPDPVGSALELGLNIDPSQRPKSAANFGELLRTAGAQAGFAIVAVPLELPPLPGTGSDSGDAGSPVRAAVGNSGPLGVAGASGGVRRHHYPPIAPTRFRPPTVNRPTVARTRILDCLRSRRRSKLVLIHAPAGYGKSTLAAQWGEILTGDGLKGAWLAIDVDDNNVDWFLSHLIEAIRRAMPDLADALQQELDGHLDNAPAYVFSTLINRLHDERQAFAVVFDDWHRVENTETLDALCYLLENCCHHLQVIVTSRNRTGLPLGSLRVQDELVEIDAEQLRFDTAESKAMLVEQCGLQLSEANVAAIEEHTDGWAAALQLTSLTLRDQPDPEAVIEHLSGRDATLGEYLASNVLDSLDPDLLEFLLATCIPKQICSSLATALTDNRRSRALLEEIERRDLFLRRMDPQGTWFEYHHLFAQYLLHRLEQDAEDRIPELHRRAAQWFIEHQMLSQAVDHLLLGGRESAAVDAVERAATDLMEQSQLTMLIGLAAKLPAHDADARPRLQVDLAWANVVLHRREAADGALLLAELALDSAPFDDAEDLRVELGLVRAVARAYEDRVDAEADVAVEACVARADRLRPFILSRAADLAAFRALRLLDFDETLRWQRWGRKFHHRMSGALSISYGYCIAALAANEQLDIAGAEAHLRHAIRIALPPSGRPTYMAKLAGAVLGDLLYEHGRYDEAEALLDDAYALGAEGGIVDFMVASYGTGARLKSVRGDVTSAQSRLAEGLDVARTLDLPRLEARVLYDSVCIAALSGQPVGDTLVQRIESFHDSARIHPDTAGLIEDARIRLLLAGSESAVADACARARARRDAVDEQVRPREHLRVTLQLAHCLQFAGRDDDAVGLLLPVLKTCAALGLGQLIVDEGPAMTRLAQQVVGIDGPNSPDVTTTKVRDFVANLAQPAD